MHPYIPHLLSDIKDAHRSDHNPTHAHSHPMTFEEEMEDLENWVRGDGRQPLVYYTGLKKEDFPPSDQLEDNDMAKIVKVFDDMLITWNARIIYPDDMPTFHRYNFLINKVLEYGTKIITI